MKGWATLFSFYIISSNFLLSAFVLCTPFVNLCEWNLSKIILRIRLFKLKATLLEVLYLISAPKFLREYISVICVLATMSIFVLFTRGLTLSLTSYVSINIDLIF